MNKLIGWGIAAVGGYFLLQHFGFLNMAATADGTTDSPQANDTTASTDTARLGTTVALMKAAFVKAGEDVNLRRSLDTLGWAYHAVTGITAPAPEDIGYTGNKRQGLYTIDEYMVAMAGKGFSGLGAIAHYVNPYWNSQGTPYGSNLLPVGFEKYVVHKGL